MTIQEFLDKQTRECRILFQTLNKLILDYDKLVTVEVGSIMSVKEAFVYKQDDVFKYGLTATKNYFSYHSMVMYAFPEVLDTFKRQSKGIVFQKGCFNFNTLESINISSFRLFLEASSQRDFSPVIKHYKQKKK
ncbi:hypothetical protein N7U66_03515 [Lacinutrix neustonica]|uniref:Uncharacterized protein n=1 Tax=Lacinutrix neustonica TaxID=2980107 RepID=A0A9E8MW73_9FLAO|nr:hypothetical protein [Lacinutrix neustonica]WAC02752.1 hypothetical protein N7U66_03515 [Lacinutrix neustonica]